jgi:hypothetical protein
VSHLPTCPVRTRKAPAAIHRTKKIDFHFRGVSQLTLQTTAKEEKKMSSDSNNLLEMSVKKKDFIEKLTITPAV